MSRSIALTIGVIIGFIILGVVGVAVLAVFPFVEVFGPTPTLTPTLTITPTPTYAVVLPTARSETPTSLPPTPINTRLPTLTPGPTKTATPETVIVPSIEAPTSTPTTNVTDATPALSPTSVPRFYTLSFEADEIVIDRGSCTTLRWQSSGPITLWLEGESAEVSGKLRICPREDTSYTMEFRVAGSAQMERKYVRIDVNR